MLHFIYTILLLSFCSICFSSRAISGVVKEIGKSQVTVDPDGETYKKGDQLCIYTSKNKKIDCGTITVVKSTSVIVKLPTKKNIKKIKRGMLVNPATDEAATAAGGVKPGALAATPKKERFNLWMGWSPTLMSPSTFNSVGYVAPTTETPLTLWEADEAVAKTMIGAVLQVGFPIGPVALLPGFRYRMFVPSRVDTDYFPKKLNPFVSSLTTATTIGLFTDVRYLNIPMGTAFALFATGGLDIEMSSLSFKSTKKDDTGATAESPMASAESSVTVISLRAGGGFNLIPFRPFGASLGINLLLPVAEFGGKFSGSIEQTETKGIVAPGNDLKAAIGHKKNKFGLDAQLSILLAF